MSNERTEDGKEKTGGPKKAAEHLVTIAQHCLHPYAVYHLVRLVNYIFRSLMCPACNNKYTAHTWCLIRTNDSYEPALLMSQLKRFTKQPWVSNLNQIHKWLPHWTESVFSQNEIETFTLQKMLFLLRFFVLFPAQISKNKSNLSEFLLRTSRIICQWDKENNLISNRKQDYLFYLIGRLFACFFWKQDNNCNFSKQSFI